MIQVILLVSNFRDGVNLTVQGFKQGFENLKAPLSYRPNGAELQITGGTRCIMIQTGIFSYRDQLVLKSF